jgi:hypothetical protein
LTFYGPFAPAGGFAGQRDAVNFFFPSANFFAEESENFAAGVPGANDRVRMCGYSSACGT